jgi:hypothetical protein
LESIYPRSKAAQSITPQPRVCEHLQAQVAGYESVPIKKRLINKEARER